MKSKQKENHIALNMNFIILKQIIDICACNSQFIVIRAERKL